MNVPSVHGGAPTTPASRHAALIAGARARARQAGRRQLVAFVEPVPARDPLDVLDALARAVADDPALAEGVGTDRMYWREPGERLSLAGFGAAETLTARGADRFIAIQRAWTQLRASTLVVGSSTRSRGVGPLLMGGAAFRDDAPGTGWWRGFPPAHFVLPRLQLAVVDGAAWVTTVIGVEPEGRCDLSPELLARLHAIAFDPPVAGTPRVASADAMLAFTDARPADDWRAAVRQAVVEIGAGALNKVVLARAVDAAAGERGGEGGELDAALALRHLRATQPECFVFGCWRGARAFVGASPERLVRLDGEQVRASSLAGSMRRGATAEEDVALIERLRGSMKDRAEESVVRLALEAVLNQLCDDVVAAERPDVLTLRHVHHLHTPVTGRLRPGCSLLDLVARLHPTPAVGGAPRDRALDFIREHEALDRGWYASPVGWVGADGGEFAVALRSALIAGRRARLFAGCGVMAGSSPDGEYEESLLKLKPMQRALAAAVVTDAGEVPLPRRGAPVAGKHAR